MISIIETKSGRVKVDFGKGIDLSIPFLDHITGVNAFFAPIPVFKPVREGSFVGEVRSGGPVNFFTVTFAPHGSGTHTECLGHITEERESVLQSFTEFHFIAGLVSVYPIRTDEGDLIIDAVHFADVVLLTGTKALIVRTMPNDVKKRNRHYGGTNPAYFTESAINWINQMEINHLLVDLPSIDKEEDGGKLVAHRLFWHEREPGRKMKTITELIYVPDEARDGNYLLNLQVSNVDLDACPSKPVIYRLE